MELIFDVLEPEPDRPISLLADSEAARGRQATWQYVQKTRLICVGLSPPVMAARWIVAGVGVEGLENQCPWMQGRSVSPFAG